MAGKTEDIAGPGKGFFTAAGALKGPEQLESNPPKATTKAADQQATDIVNTKSLSNALGAVRSRSSEQVNNAISTLNVAQADIEAAADLSKEQLETAKKLQSALNDGDAEKAEELKAKFNELQEKRASLQSEIKSNNRERVESGNARIGLGNVQKLSVAGPEVDFQKSVGASKLDTSEDVGKVIRELKAEQKDLKSQSDAIETKKKEIFEVGKEIRTQLNEISKTAADNESKAINSISQAEKSADSIATSIVGAGSQAFLVSDIKEDIVKNLLTA